MNLFVFKPYSLVFYSTLLLGTFIALTSNNWFSVWMGLEVNMYSFIPLLLQSNTNQEKEAAVKYFIVQALASGLLLTASQFFSYTISWFFISTALMMKLALAPCHFWLPAVMNSLSWNMCWLLTTFQKVAPLFLLSQIFYSANMIFLTLISMLSGLIGGIGGLKQTQLRPILAYSSIGHLGWLTATMFSSTSIFNLYFLSYLFLITSIMFILLKYSINNMSPFTFVPGTSFNPILSIALLSLGGLPPLFGFFPKLIVLYTLTQSDLILLPFVLTMSSTINLYYYLKIVFFSSLQSPSVPTLHLFYTPSFSMLFPFIFSISSILGLFLLIILF